MYGSAAYGASTYGGAPPMPPNVTDDESTAAIGEDESIGVGSGSDDQGAGEDLWLNVDGDEADTSGAYGSGAYGSHVYGGAPLRRGDDWDITATFTDADATPAISESEAILQYVDLDLSSSEPSFLSIHDLRWGHRLNQRSWASFRVFYPGVVPTYYAPRAGHRFRLRDFSGTVRFHGSIHVTRAELHNDGSNKQLWIVCECTGWEQIADRFIVSQSGHQVYTSQSLKAIVEDLVNTYLADDDITATGLPTGPTLDKVVLSYRRVSDAFDELSRLTGYWWRINADKNVEFYTPASASASPLTIDANGLTYRRMEVETDRSQYRNKQYLSNVTATNSPDPETFAGDLTNQAFPLKYDVHSTPTITVNGSPALVGIRDVDAGKDFYWSKGSAEIVPATGAARISSDTVVVTYTGEFMQIRAVTDSAEVTDRQSIEGGTGIYEWLTDDGAGLTTAAAADAYAQSLIDRFAPIPSRVRIETDSAGDALPGQYVSITEPALGLSGDFFIEEAEFEVLAGTEVIRARLNVTSNEPEAAWQAAWQARRQTEDLTQTPTSGV